jgi:hypothetical protein
MLSAPVWAARVDRDGVHRRVGEVVVNRLPGQTAVVGRVDIGVIPERVANRNCRAEPAMKAVAQTLRVGPEFR